MAVLGLRFCARAFSSCGKRGHSSSRCAGLSPSRPLLLQSTGSRRAGSVVVAHGPSCSAACGIFPHQGLNPCPLHWQADSQPLRHHGSPIPSIFTTNSELSFPLLNCCLFESRTSFCSLLCSSQFHMPHTKKSVINAWFSAMDFRKAL